MTRCSYGLRDSWNVLARNGSLPCGWLSGRLSGRFGWFRYSTFAETLRALGRIDSAARLRWLFDLLEPCAITGGTNSFGHTLTRFFHLSEDSASSCNRATQLAS
jgi:hypothetical protein